MIDWITLRGLIAALAAGMLIGIERGWRLRDDPAGSRVAGFRTFTLLGAGGGLSALIVVGLGPLVGAVPLAGIVAVLVIGFARAPHAKGERDATTLVAAMITLALGLLAASGRPGFAVAGAAVATLVLALRSQSHRLLDRLSRRDIDSLAYYAVVAGGVLPFLPNARFGPYGAWNPFKLWLVVVLVTGFSFAGYIANRLIGERKGTLATAVLGGVYSSTALTSSLAARMRGGEEGPLTAGIAIATAIMYVRVLILVGVLAAPVLVSMLWMIGPAMIAAWAVSAFAWLRSGEESAGHSKSPGNPIALLPALVFLIAVAGAALLVRWAQADFGERGVGWSLFMAGSFDVDAAIVTLAGLATGTIPPKLAAIALGGTVAVNMAFKMAVTGVTARGRGTWAVAALGVSLVVLLATLGWTVVSGGAGR
ncbi:MAG: MgtC/SapB family protein [Sphingomicrobium sp.]